MLNLVLAVVVLAHGVGHLLFFVPAVGLASWADQTGHSWLLTAAIGDASARTIAAFVWAVATILFVGGVAGYWMSQEWWRAVTIAAAVVSLVGIVVFWDGIATSSALMALVVDVLVLIALVWARWPAAQSGTSV
jgi:hypothetical protein